MWPTPTTRRPCLCTIWTDWAPKAAATFRM